jgi:hypothetical protein
MDETSLITIAVAIGLIFVFGLVLYSQRHRLAKMAVTAGLEGIEFSAEFHEIVRREVSRVTGAMLHRTIVLDKQLIELWERKALPQDGDAAAKLSLRLQQVADLEKVLGEVATEDRVSVGMALRDAYWDLLREARSFYASSQGYQDIRRRVMNGLSNLEKLSA